MFALGCSGAGASCEGGGGGASFGTSFGGSTFGFGFVTMGLHVVSNFCKQ